MRQIILDTETTGLDPAHGHRLIEIGCLELVNRKLTRRSFHYYLNPGREVEAEAMAVHGITNEFLADKPLFASIADEFIAFVRGAELIIHNAPFDLSFINHELKLLQRDLPPITEYCGVLDTLVMARAKHPGQKNNLDALARRYGADQRDRSYHGALLDSEILAEVYLAMTGGQVGLQLGNEENESGNSEQRTEGIRRLPASRRPLPVIRADEQELARHEAKLKALDKAAGGACLWR
ncbi:MAG: DNA polymerase III subunit epsilon [bacterium]|nr:DNA polymerase III subunit epsilon [bacterium]